MLAKLISRLFWLLLAALLIVFSIANRQPVDLHIPLTDFIIPLRAFWLLFAGIIIGVLLAGSISGWMRLKGFVEVRKSTREVDRLKEQMDAMSEDAGAERSIANQVDSTPFKRH